jgi:hypothetical protein
MSSAPSRLWCERLRPAQAPIMIVQAFARTMRRGQRCHVAPSRWRSRTAASGWRVRSEARGPLEHGDDLRPVLAGRKPVPCRARALVVWADILSGAAGSDLEGAASCGPQLQERHEATTTCRRRFSMLARCGGSHSLVSRAVVRGVGRPRPPLMSMARPRRSCRASAHDGGEGADNSRRRERSSASTGRRTCRPRRAASRAGHLAEPTLQSSTRSSHAVAAVIRHVGGRPGEVRVVRPVRRQVGGTWLGHSPRRARASCHGHHTTPLV